MNWKQGSIHLVCLVLLGGLLPLSAQSQENDADKNDDAVHFEEVVVTARKRVEKIQETPVSMAAFSAEEVEKAGIRLINDALDLVPNVSMIDIQNPGNNFVTIRAATQTLNGEPPVAMLVDDVYLPVAQAITQDLFDVERIEIMKGPQGALYGRNAIGGAISIVTKRPTYESEHKLQMGVGDGEHQEALFSSSGSLNGDNLFYRVAGSYRDRDGYIDNDFLGRGADPRTDTSFSGRLLYAPSERFDLDLRISSMNTEAAPFKYINVDDGMPNDTSVNPTHNFLGEDSDRDLSMFSAKAVFKGDWGSLTSISAYQEIDEFFEGDGDATPLSIQKFGQGYDFEGFSQELRYTSPQDRRWRTIAGVFFSNEEYQQSTLLEIDGDQNGSFDFPIIDTAEGQDNQSTAVFAQLNYDATDRLELSLSLRYDKHEREQTDLKIGGARARDFDATQAKLTASWKAGEDALVYGTFSQGFRGGGFNGPNTVFPGTYEKETTDNFEVGFKSDWLDRRLRFNGAAFLTQFDNYHSFLFNLATFAQGIFNVDEARASGLELDMAAIINRQWRVYAGLGLIDTEIDRVQSNHPVLAPFGDVTGNKLQNTPDYSANLGLEMNRPLTESLHLLWRTDYQKQGKLYWHLDNNDVRDPLDLVNMRLGLSGKTWSVMGHVTNLTDEAYNAAFYAGEFVGIPTDRREPAPGRVWGLTAKKAF